MSHDPCRKCSHPSHTGICDMCGCVCYQHSAPVRVFMVVAPYVVAFCLGALFATLWFERTLPSNMRTNYAKAAAGTCELAADYCRKACE